MTELWQEYDRHTTGVWQTYDRSMTEIWQEYDRDMTGVWHKYDRSMTEIRQEYDRNTTGVWQRYDRDMGKQLVPQVSLQFTNLDAGKIFIILTTNLAGNCQEYDRDMTEIWQNYYKDMTEIWQKYDRNMTGIWQECDRDMTEIWQRHFDLVNSCWVRYSDPPLITPPIPSTIMISSTFTLTTLLVSLIALALKSLFSNDGGIGGWWRRAALRLPPSSRTRGCLHRRLDLGEGCPVGWSRLRVRQMLTTKSCRKKT